MDLEVCDMMYGICIDWLTLPARLFVKKVACLVQGTYQTLLPWFKNDYEKVIEIVRKPVGASTAGAVGLAQRIALYLSYDKFRLVSKGLKHMEADFGKSFLVEHHEEPG